MINLKNRREAHLPYTLAPATVVLAPTTTATLAPRWVCPVPGRVKGLILTDVVASAIGTSVNVKDTVHVSKRGVTGAVTAVLVTAAPALLDAAAVITKAVGQEVLVLGLAGNHCVQGEVLEAVWTETGTLGDATRPTFSIAGLLYEADMNLDATQQPPPYKA